MKTKILDYLPANFGWRENLIWFDAVDSTNTRAKSMAILGIPHGTVLIADRQTVGRGRMGRSFDSPAGMGIYMSVILRPQCKSEDLMHLTCAAAVAMCDAVEAAVGFRPGIKWTNDLVAGRRKIAGILTELVTMPKETAVIVGIGINCCQDINDFAPELQSFAGSLSMATGAPVDRAKVAAEMILALKKMDETLLTDKAHILSRYREDCITVGKDISLQRGDELFYGHAFGVDDDGALLVGFPDGHTEAVNSGEVSIRGMYGYIYALIIYIFRVAFFFAFGYTGIRNPIGTEAIVMKVFGVIVKIVVALAAVAGLIYVAATYGDKIVAWAKKMLGVCKGCCEGDVIIEEAGEAPAEEVPAEEAPAQESEVTETDFEG